MLKVGQKTIITLQEGGVWNEKWPAPSGDPWPLNATTYTEFYDSSGAVVLSVPGTVDKQYLTYQQAPAVMHPVPNGAGFNVFCVDTVGPHIVRYGTVFRRQNFFPDSPSELAANVPLHFTDDFQRPAGAPGGRWHTLVGQPHIFAGVPPLPNSVGPNFDFFASYFMRYYVPFSGDSIDLSISCIHKGSSKTIVAIDCSSDATSYLYAGFDGAANTVELGIGHGPDIGTGFFGFGGPSPNLEPQTSPVALTVPSASVGNYKMRYDDVTKKFSFFNSDYTTLYTSWTDTNDLVPHGRGYRYFGVGGNSGLFDSGVQISYISAQDMV